MTQRGALSPSERRSHVRGEIFFKVKFRIISPEQYKEFKRSDGENFSLHGKQLSIDLDNGEKATADPSLIHFLLHLDDKLDQILTLLKQEARAEGPCQGVGVNIGGSCLRRFSI